MLHVMRDWLAAGIALGDGGTIGGQPASIQSFTEIKQHAKANATPADAAAPEGGKTIEDRAGEIGKDIATLEQYQATPGLQGAREALAHKPLKQEDLAAAAAIIERVADQHIASLKQSLDGMAAASAVDQPAAGACERVRQLLEPLNQSWSDKTVDTALAELAKYVSRGNELSPADQKAISASLGDAVATRIDFLANHNPQLKEGPAKSQENMELQRALLLADILNGDTKVRDIGGQGSKQDFDIDGYFGRATQQSFKEFLGEGPADAAGLGKLSATLRAEPQAVQPAHKEVSPVVVAQAQVVAEPEPEKEPPPEQVPDPTPVRQEVPPDQVPVVPNPEVPKTSTLTTDDRPAIESRTSVAADRVLGRFLYERKGDRPELREEFVRYRNQPVDDALVGKALDELKGKPHFYEKARRELEPKDDEDLKRWLKVELERLLKASESQQLAFLDSFSSPPDGGTAHA